MNTYFAIMAEFNSAIIPLDQIAERYLGIAPTKAKLKAARSELPFPAFRGGSQKSPWLVNAKDLAEWLDRERDEAAQEWMRRNVG